MSDNQTTYIRIDLDGKLLAEGTSGANREQIEGKEPHKGVNTLPRDTQFAGFAKKLLGEMIALHGYIDISGFWNDPDDETVQEYSQIIARRAYDLVRHAIAHIQTANGGCTIDEHVDVTPDMITWPEEAQ